MRNSVRFSSILAALLSVAALAGCQNQEEPSDISTTTIVTAEEELKNQETSSTSSVVVEEPNPLNEITFTDHKGTKTDPIPFGEWVMGEYSPTAYDAENLPDPETVCKVPIQVTAVYRGEAYKNCKAAEADYQAIYEGIEGNKPEFDELQFEPYVVEYQILIPKGFEYEEILGTTDFAISGADGQLYNKYIYFTNGKAGKSLSGATECKVGDTVTMYWICYVDKTDQNLTLQGYNYTEEPFFFSGKAQTTFGTPAAPTTSSSTSEPNSGSSESTEASSSSSESSSPENYASETSTSSYAVASTSAG